MVNSGSFDAAGSEGESGKAEFTQLEDDAAEANFTAVVPSAAAAAETAVLDTIPDKAPKTSLQCSVPLDKVKNVLELCNNKSKLNNYFILESYLKQKSNEITTEMPESNNELVQKPAVKRLMCLFCDRTFTSNNLKQKHVDRCHSSGQTRRSSSRTPSHNHSATACCFCSKLNHTDHTLKQLFEHLISEHSNRYFACLPCQERFSSVQTLRDHNRLVHDIQDTVESKTPSPTPVATDTTSCNYETTTGLLASEGLRPELKRTCSNDSTSSKSENILPPSPKENSSPSNLSTTKQAKRNSSVKNIPTPDKNDPENDKKKSAGFHEDFEDAIHANIISPEEAKKSNTPEIDVDDLVLTRRVKNGVVNSKTKNTNKKTQIVNKKISVKSTKNGVRNNLRTTRATVKQVNNNLMKTRKNKVVKNESESNKKIVTKKPESNPASVFSLVNAYTYKYEKIYNHASDSIKDANSVQFNAVFDREFYTRTVCNIRDNLLHHLDGKLNRNIESESRISNFEHNANVSEIETKPANNTVDNFGCDLSLNAVTPVATLLGSSQYGEDFDAQIEYGAKASQKKSKKVAVVKYKFPNKKYNSLFRAKDSHNDLTCLDMWTQLSVKKRQHKYTDDCSFTEEFLHYHRPTGEATHNVEELNRILDTRGPFEDLRIEANTAQFLELRKKSVKDGDNISEEASKDVYFVLEDLLNRVMCKCNENTVMKTETNIEEIKEHEETKIDTKEEETQDLELPSYLQLQKSPSNLNDIKIDKTDSIALICSSQDENEMKEKKRLELSGEWARPRIYICATCGLKVPNLKYLDDHKSMNHPHIWCSHYEFVGKQSQIYRHLSIPGLGKVGVVELMPVNRLWQRSDARMCSKCSKSCHNLGELHKHILECGGDWTWMLARKKCKYRPYGARTRRRRQRGYKRSCNPEVNRAREHKPKIKPIFIGPRPKPSKPSDAETIERMLANLPPKRNRKMISMRDGIQRPRKPYKQKLNNQSSSNSHNNNLSSKSSNKKVHFKNNSPQITKQTLRNALKRKMSAKILRKQNNTEIETDSSDTPLKLRSRVKKDNDETEITETVTESDITQQLIGKRSKIRNKRMISRILGSKIFDTNSALVTRRKLVKAITQNNLIRKTRLRSKMNVQQSSINQKEEEMTGEVEEKLAKKTKALQENGKNSEKKNKMNSKNLIKLDENDSKSNKKDESKSKSNESDSKTIKKSKNKRFLSGLTKSNKKPKVPITTDKDKPDTISAVIDEVVSRAAKEEELREEKINAEEKTEDKKIRRTRSSSSLLKIDPNETKNNKVEEITENKNDNTEETKSVIIKETEKVLGKKTNKLVQKVKSFRKSFRKPNKNKTEEKKEGIASKLTRTFSMRGSKRKKTAKNETKAQKLSPSTETVDQEIDLKKTTTDVSNQSKEPENENNTTDLETAVTPCDKNNDSECKPNDSENMPTLEKIEPLPSNISSNTSVNSIPILCPVNVNPCCENNVVMSVQEQKETKSDSDVCSEVSDNITELTSCDKSSANTCNNTLNKFKSKIKRPGRGLNDCIAMLKCKLEQKFPTNEPSLVDKSNLFILNSSEVIKHSQPVVQEKIEITPSSSVDSTKINEDTLINNDLEYVRSSINLNDSLENKTSEYENIKEVINEPKKPEVKSINVLEIPSVKIHSKCDVSTSEMSTVETQTQTEEDDEDIVPNAAIDYTSIPTNIQSNFQLSYVLNATLQNCLMECIKNKCDELKTENQNYPLNLKSNQNKSGTKIGSVRKRTTTRKPRKNVIEKEKHIPNIPVLLNTAFSEKSTPKKMKNKINLDSTTDSIKAASDTSDDDIPLSKFVSDSSSCTKLKIKLPVAKKKRASKKHIAFTPLILNNQDSCIPQISLQERIEQRISLDNSMNDKIEAIQNEVAATNDKSFNDTPVAKDTNNEIIENKSYCSEIITNSEKMNIETVATENTESATKETEIAEETENNDNIPVDLSNKKDLCNTDLLPETVEILSANDEVEKLNNENLATKLISEEQNIPIKSVEDASKEVLQENSVNVDVSKPEETSNELTNIKDSTVAKEVIDSLHPISQQIMTLEDEPCDSFLINKTLTEVNIKPPTPTKNVFQSNSTSENIEFINKLNHFDSGKENTECQKIKKQRKVIKKQKAKRKRGRTKTVNHQAEINETITDLSANTDLDQSAEKTEDEICNISVEDIPQEINETLPDNFKSQLQTSLENDQEPMVMENKNIQDTQININISSTSLDQNVSSSDSEDELPLAVLFKNKKHENSDSPTVEDNTELFQVELDDKFEETLIETSDLNEIAENIIANDIPTSEENSPLNIEVILSTLDDCSNKNSIDDYNEENVINSEESTKLENATDVNIFNSIENNKEISFINSEVQQEINESADVIISESICNENETKITEATEIVETAEKENTSNGLLETHFNEEINTVEPIINPVNILENENNTDQQQTGETTEPTEKPEELFDYEKTPSNTRTSDNDSSFITTPDLADKSLVIKIKTNIKIKIRKPKRTRRRVIPKSLSKNNVKRKEKEEEEMNVAIICDICNKTFKRKENLASHKKTLTHIAKLSEIEARESMAKRLNEKEEENEVETTKEPESQIVEKEENKLVKSSSENDEEKNIVQDEIQTGVNQITEDLEPEVVNNLEDTNISKEQEIVEPVVESAAENIEIKLQEPEKFLLFNIIAEEKKEINTEEQAPYQQPNIVAEEIKETVTKEQTTYQQPDVVTVENKEIVVQEPENYHQANIPEEIKEIVTEEQETYQQPDVVAVENKEIIVQEPENYHQINIVADEIKEMNTEQQITYQQLDIVPAENEEINLQEPDNYKESDIVELDDDEPDFNEIKDDLIQKNEQKLPVHIIPVEEKEIIEIDDESSADSQPVIVSENFVTNNEPEIVRPIENILNLESQKQNTNLLPGLIVSSKNSNLKLVDIISEVLDKPVNDLHIGESHYLPQTITRSANNCDSNEYSEPKRYKSLGERKSFDSDNFNLPPKSNDGTIKENYNTSIVSVNNGLLSKQLSLLENIIEETNPNLNYIDDSISISSSQFDEPVEQNISEKDLFKPEYTKLNDPQIKFSHNADVLSSFIKPNNHFNNFENISVSIAKTTKHKFGEATQPTFEEEQQKKSIKENTKRKILNRDEELFLECCSLLKSGPEISSVSKKSTRNIPLNNFSRSNDASWIIQKQPNSDQFIQRDSYSWLAQSSRVDTPIGEPFGNNDWSNSNSAVSSEWLAQKAASPDRPTENNTLVKKSNNNSGETKYSDQFEDISIDTSLETSKTLMAVDNSNTENIPLDFHNVDFSNKNIIDKREESLEEIQIPSEVELNENSENTTTSSKEQETDAIEELKQDLDLNEPELTINEDEPNIPEFDSELKKKVVSAFGGLMAKALTNRLHAVVRKSKKSKGKRDFASAIQASITDYAIPVKKNKLNHTDSDSNDCPKKLITKGAMKVFEGLKVSIPTQDLNLKEVLNCSNKPKNGETIVTENEPVMNGEIKENEILEKSSEKVVETKKNGKLKNLFSRFGNKLGLRETKKKSNKHRSKSKNHTNNKKSHDVYEFEESVDSNFVFKTGKFSLFRNKEQNSDKTENVVETNKEIEEEKIDDTKLNHESGISSLKWNGNESESDTDRYYDSMSFEEMSLSSESMPGSDPNSNKTKPIQKKNSEKSKENQKKCMIMGRIFKNASKPKLEDKIPEIRDISSEENSKIVSNFIDSCSSVDNVENVVHHEVPTVPNNFAVVNNSANKMSKVEMDLLFDKLLEEEKKHTESTIVSTISLEKDQPNEEVDDLPLPLSVDKNHAEKKKVKDGKTKTSGKVKKRQRHNSGDSTSSDEFTLGGRHSKSTKKHHKTQRKSTKAKKDTGINLEQEMKECIGVAGRKSQRKCTSGKQNVLIEFWSSDESSFEEVIKMLAKESEPAAPVDEEKNVEELDEFPPPEPEEPLVNNSSLSNSNLDLPNADIVENTPKNNLDIYEFDSDPDPEPKQDHLKIKIKLNEPIPKPESEFLPSSKIKIPKKTKRIGKSRKHIKSHGEESDDTEFEAERNRKREHKRKKCLENDDELGPDSNPDCLAITRKKRNAGDQLYYWSSSSDDEFQDLIEVKPIREDTDDDRPMQHGWIVGDSPKKLVTMLAQAKGKKVEGESVKEQGKKNRVPL